MDRLAAFELGHSPVLALEPAGVGNESGAWTWGIGRRPDVVRIESPTARAWDFDAAGRLLRTEQRDRWRQYTLDQRSWGQTVVGRGASRRLVHAPARADARPAVQRAHQVARALIRALERGRLRARVARGTCADPEAAALAWLRPCAAWDSAALDEDLARLRRLLLPIPVLPPDQYAALPIQLTEGCSWNACRFCTLYEGVRYRERSPQEIARILDALLDHLGPSTSRFRRIFLGQANALMVDDPVLHAHLDEIDARFPRPPAHLPPAERRAWIASRPAAVQGFSSFLDAFHRTRSTASWAALRERGLLRVHVGVETGSEALLLLLGKPVEIARVRSLASTLHEAGVPMGLIFLAGVGGAPREQEHLESTAALLGTMDLQRGDQIYISPLNDPSAPAPNQRFAQAAVHRLRERIRMEIAEGIPVATYDLPLLSERVPRA